MTFYPFELIFIGWVADIWGFIGYSEIGVMEMSYIMDSGQNRLYTTFPSIFSLLSADSADLSKNQKKKKFSKKNHDFWIKNVI